MWTDSRIVGSCPCGVTLVPSGAGGGGAKGVPRRHGRGGRRREGAEGGGGGGDRPQAQGDEGPGPPVREDRHYKIHHIYEQIDFLSFHVCGAAPQNNIT